MLHSRICNLHFIEKQHDVTQYVHFWMPWDSSSDDDIFIDDVTWVFSLPRLYTFSSVEVVSASR